MLSYRSSDACQVGADDVTYYRRTKDRATRAQENVRDEIGWTFESKMGRETVLLSEIEFRILTFLAATPYRAYSPRRIVGEVSSQETPMSTSALTRHIASIRRKLGFFADLIQTVPHLGYRYKA